MEQRDIQPWTFAKIDAFRFECSVAHFNRSADQLLFDGYFFDKFCDQDGILRLCSEEFDQLKFCPFDFVPGVFPIFQ